MVKIIELKDIIDGQEIWACAYETNNTEKGMHLKRKPVLGVIENRHFYELNKKGEKIKSKRVSVWSRKFAYTEGESITIYNDLVRHQIEFLEGLIKDCKYDLIELPF